MKNRKLTKEQLIEVLKNSTAGHVHIYIPFDDLIVVKENQLKGCTYILVDKHSPKDDKSRFISGRDYLELYISDDLEWIKIKTHSATNHLKSIETVMSFLK